MPSLMLLFETISCFHLDFQQVQTVLMGNIAVNDAPKIQINSDDPASTLKTLLLSYVRHEVSAKLTILTLVSKI